MAEMKKYLDTIALGALVDQIKAEDAKALAAAKKYTDDSVALCDEAGAAASALNSAKAYTDELANGQVNTNKEAIATLNGDANTDGSVAKAVATAQAALQASIDAVDEKADQNASDIEAIEGKVAEIEAGMYDDTAVRELITANANAIEALGQTHATDKGALEAAIALKADQTALDAVSAVANAAVKQSDYDVKVKALEDEDVRIAGLVSAEAERAAGAEEGLAARIKAVEDDYLKAADKTELQGKIDLKVAQTDFDAKVEEIKGTTDGLQSQIDTIMNNPDAEEAINSINEFAAWVAEHGTVADGMRTDINKNKDDIAAEVKRAGDAEAALAGRLDVLEDIDHEAYVAADTALENKLNAEIAKKADTTALEAAVEALEAADEEMAGKIATLEGKFTGEGSVEDMIADAKDEAIAAAAEDAATKAGQALTDAKAYTDAEVLKDRNRLDALEAIDHEHANKALLDTYTQTEANLADAVAKKHEHANATVLDGITADKVSAWDAAEQNAKTYADGLNSAMTTKVDGVDNRVKALEEAAPTYALDADLDKAVERIAQNEFDIATVTSAVNSFTAITADEVNALFA